MQAQYAADTLKPVPPDHLRAQIATTPDEVRQRAEADSVGVVRQILGDQGGKATVDQITELLVPEIFNEATFKKWWEATKKRLKTDGHFVLPAKKSDPLVLRDTPVDKTVELIAAFRAARQLKQQIGVLEKIAKDLPAFESQPDVLREMVLQVDDVARKNQRLNAGETVELLLARDEIVAHLRDANAVEPTLTIADILRGASNDLAALFEEIPAAKQRRVLAFLPVAFGENWTAAAVRLMGRSHSRLVGEIARLFEEHGLKSDFRALLERSIADRSISSDMLHWLARDRKGAFQDVITPDLFGAIIHALEHDQVDSMKRASRLNDLLFEDRELIPDLLADAPVEAVRNSVRRLLLTPVFEELNKRSLLARIVKIHPGMESMISGDDGPQGESLTVSWVSLERRKAEYDDIVNRQIPQNTRDISIARSYGDLRENHEFKSAKEMQTVIMRRRGELEQQLSLARGTNFENPETATVSIGTTVTLSDLATGETEQFHILGAWDGAPQNRIVSYQASIGKVLLGRKVGDEVELPMETGTRRVSIVSIEAFKNLELLG